MLAERLDDKVVAGRYLKLGRVAMSHGFAKKGIRGPPGGEVERVGSWKEIDE